MVAHNHQIRLERDDSFQIDIGAHPGLEFLCMLLQIFRPLDDLGGGDPHQVHSQGMEGQHRCIGQSHHPFRFFGQGYAAGDAVFFQGFGIGQGHRCFFFRSGFLGLGNAAGQSQQQETGKHQ